MVVGGRSPNKTLFSRENGRIWQLDFYPTVRRPVIAFCLIITSPSQSHRHLLEIMPQSPFDHLRCCCRNPLLRALCITKGAADLRGAFSE